MKKIVVGFIFALFMMGTCSVALATVMENAANDGYEDRSDGSAYEYYQNSGTFLGVIEENVNSYNYLLDWLNDKSIDTTGLIQTAVEIYGYDGSGSDKLLGTTGDSDGKLDVDTDIYTSGTWKTVLSSSVLSYYIIKASTYSALYRQDPADSVGSWSTYDLWVAKDKGETLTVSHFVVGGGAAPVPEPSTLLLLGGGLIGLAYYRRRKN